MADFLLEIGLEEIPARMLNGAREELVKRVSDVVTRERLSSSPSAESFATPRRLAVIVRGLAESQPDVTEQITGPAVKVAYKDGKPTPAAEAFAKKAGVAVDKLTTVTNPKGEYLAATVTSKGRSAAEVLTESLPKEIASLYWAKNMYWRGKSAERFVRPVRWMVALLDGKVVPLEFGGIKAGSESRGHRVLGGAVSLKKPTDYAEALGKSHVFVSPADREKRIREALDAAVKKVTGARWREDAALLESVVNLTEFPSVVLGSFEREYLTLPEEVLVTVMRDHQKYFAVEDANGKLAPHFLAVLNTDGDPDGLIRHGNERVLRARFNDARFFWETDQKTKLRDRVEMLKAVTFQKDLGSYFEKAGRIAHLVTIGGADLDTQHRKVKRNALYEAAWLCKADLTTELVKEFTELQGVIGGLYAKAQGHSPEIADAIYGHYKPESMDDAVPASLESAILAIADKADTIAGMFALGLQPTGSKDPFALRRQANGIIKIIAEHHLPIDLNVLFHLALVGYKGSEAEKKFKNLENYAPSINAFMRERLEFYLRDAKGFAYDEVNAVLAAGFERVTDVVARAQAVAEVRKTADFEPISAAFKRIKNILRQAEEKKVAIAEKFDASLSDSDAEKNLAALVEKTEPVVADLRKHRNYVGALAEIAKLRPALDTFFDKVMVMVEDEKVRANRLALLNKTLRDFSTIADFSEIVTEKK